MRQHDPFRRNRDDSASCQRREMRRVIECQRHADVMRAADANDCNHGRQQRNARQDFRHSVRRGIAVFAIQRGCIEDAARSCTRWVAVGSARSDASMIELLPLQRLATRHIAPRTQNEKPLDPSGSRGFVFWRRGWDSNPRYGETVRLISSQVHSTTLPPLLPYCISRLVVSAKEKIIERSLRNPQALFANFLRELQVPAGSRSYDACAGASMRSMPPMYGRSTSGTVTEPSAFW